MKQGHTKTEVQVWSNEGGGVEASPRGKLTKHRSTAEYGQVQQRQQHVENEIRVYILKKHKAVQSLTFSNVNKQLSPMMPMKSPVRRMHQVRLSVTRIISDSISHVICVE